MDKEKTKKQLEKEFNWFLDNQGVLVQKYKDKVVVIKNFSVKGAYDSFNAAINETVKTEELGTFIVQKCSIDPADYVSIVHSGAY